jgi:hypothetical protein
MNIIKILLLLQLSMIMYSDLFRFKIDFGIIGIFRKFIRFRGQWRELSKGVSKYRGNITQKNVNV